MFSFGKFFNFFSVFRMKTPPLIRDKTTLKEKINLLEALTDIEVAIRTLKSETDDDCNPLDRHYAAMKCDLKPISSESEEFKVLFSDDFPFDFKFYRAIFLFFSAVHGTVSFRITQGIIFRFLDD